MDANANQSGAPSRPGRHCPCASLASVMPEIKVSIAQPTAPFAIIFPKKKKRDRKAADPARVQCKRRRVDLCHWPSTHSGIGLSAGRIRRFRTHRQRRIQNPVAVALERPRCSSGGCRSVQLAPAPIVQIGAKSRGCPYSAGPRRATSGGHFGVSVGYWVQAAPQSACKRRGVDIPQA